MSIHSRARPTIASLLVSIVLGIATSTGRPEHSASIVLVRPQRNSVNHFFTIDIDGAEFP